MSSWVRIFFGFFLALAVQPIYAQDPGDRTFTALGNGAVGQAGSVGATGNLTISLPLTLPSPRGALPLPFGVVYNGSNSIGAAGIGWDIPILGVTRQHNLSRRKPLHRFTSEADPATADRIFLDVGNGPMLMAPTNTPGVFQPFANGFYELKFASGAFTGRDVEGRLWIFQKLPALFDDDFFALVRIVDASGINRMDLAYDVFDKFSPNPIVTPRADQISARELVLRELSYSHDETGACPKYRVRLRYSASPTPLGLEFVRGRPRSRSHLLQRIELLAAGNTTCEATSIRVEQTFRIEYKPDPVTTQPRLTNVDMLGPITGVTGELNTALPVVSYTYGAPVVAGGLRYAEAESIQLPAGPSDANRGFAATLGKGGGAIYGHVRGFHDMNGDGRLDFVTLNAAGANPVLAINRPSALGNDFSTLPTSINLPNEPSTPYNIGTPDLAFGLPVLANIDNTFQQVIDFNGDGRPDIIVAADGRNSSGKRDPNFWQILINQPGPSGQPSDIVWLTRNIDISALRSAIMRKHVLSIVASTDQGSKMLPVERTHQTGVFENRNTLESSVLTQWKLIDVNGDGFPDFVFDSEGMTASTEQRCDAAGKCKPVIRQDHGDNAKLMVIYHTGPMMAGSGAETQNVWRGPAVTLREDGACGVNRMVSTDGVRQLQCGFLEANGDGIVDYVIGDKAGNRVILSPGLAQAHDARLPDNRVPANYAAQEQKRTIALPGPVGVLKDPRSNACTGDSPGSKTYDIEQISELRDITGDGIADYVFFGGSQMPPGNPEGPQGWWFMAGTGTGFVAARAIRSPQNIPFALNVSTERCDGTFSNTIASLIDLDGDGHPEVVQSPNAMNVRVAKLTNAASELGAHSAGQITAIDNRYGSITRFRYGSAKSDWLGQQNLPYPQIVVTESEQIAAFNLGTSLAPVRYAYGSPEQIYHPLLGRFVFRGYGRKVEIHGEPATFNTVEGTVSVTFGVRAAEFTDPREKLMLTGRAREVVILAGTAPVDPRRLLASTASVPTVERASMIWKTKALPGAVPLLVPLEDECYSTPRPQTPGQFGDLTLCRRTANAFIADSTTSEGPQAFPQPNNVATRTRVLEVDSFGRPLRQRLDGDRRRADDDICLQTEYATPVPGAPRVLDVPKSIKTHVCSNPSLLLSSVRFAYDDLPLGQARLGRPTAQIIERRNTATRQLIAIVPSGTLKRDLFGNPVEVTRTIAGGPTTTTKITYDPFGLMPVRSETTASGLAKPLITETVRQPHSLLPLTVTDTTGASVHNRFDNFSRLTRVSVTKPGDPIKYVLVDMTLAGFDGAATGRSIRYKVFHKFVPESEVATAPANTFTTYTTVLDEFTRQMHSIVELGADYNGRSMIVDSVTYDALGRPRFAAGPFPSSTSGPRYGTTFTYLADGRLRCTIDGTGVQTQTTTDEAVDRYPTCHSYKYQNGQLLVQTRGPNEIATGKPQSRALDEDAISATGLLLRRSRKQGASTLELAEYGYDRLGNLAQLRRFANPGGSSTKTRWGWINDSLGHVLEAQELAGVKRRFTYDDWGNVTAVRSTDSTGIVALQRGVHFVYDGLARLTRTFESINDEQQTDTLKEYFYDLPSGQPQQLDTNFLAGQLSFARAAGRSEFFGYDSLGRLTTVTHSGSGQNFTQRTVLDAAGQAESLSFISSGANTPAQEILYAYDSARRLQSVGFKEDGNVSELWRALETDIFGRVVRSRRGNGAVEQFTYRDGARRELLSKRIDANNRTRQIEFEGYDGAMLLKGIKEQPGITQTPETSTQYVYDARNSLARAVVRTGLAISSDLSYTYDGLGNMKEIVDAVGSSTIQFRVDKFDPDRICSVGTNGPPSTTCSYRYDAAGAVRSEQGAGSLFTYDGAGRVRSARKDTRVATMNYDPFGSLSELRISDGQIERRESFFGAVSQVAFFNNAGDPVVVGPPNDGLQSFTDIAVESPIGVVAALRRSNTGARAILYPIGEAQGTRNVLGENGSATQDITYDPYGNVLSDTGNSSSLTFFPYQWNGGHVLEGFRLVALDQRLLDNRTGRFLQRDPVINTSTSGTAHPYAFAWDNPVSFVDPTGAEPEQSTRLTDNGNSFGRYEQENASTASPTVQPEIDMSFTCGYDFDCMRKLEGGQGGFTDYEKGLKENFDRLKKRGANWTPSYHLIFDRTSGALLGYAFLGSVSKIFDRSGNLISISETPLESPLLSPIDFVGAGLASWVGKKFLGHAIRSTAATVEGTAAREAVEGGAASMRASLPPWKFGAANMVENGATDYAGNIVLNPNLVKQGAEKLMEVLGHEGVHRFLSARSGPWLGFRRRWAEWFYENSHLLRYSEEALAEGITTMSLRRGLAFPFTHGYGINAFRLAGEASAAAGGYGGLLYGSYQLGGFLGGDSDRR
jgi:RHS repeat-associated protein